MGQILRMFMSYTPGVVYAYNMKNYDPLKGQQQKLIRPGAAVKLSFASENKPLSTLTPSWRRFFTTPIYRAAYTDYRRATHLGNDNIRLDPVVWRDWNAGMAVQWQGGKYINESPFKGPRTFYEHMKAHQNTACPCK